MNITQTLQYYQNLLITQYRIKPKAKATIALVTNQSFCDGLPLELARCFDLNTAVGAQLDIIGRIVGVSRLVFGLDLQHRFFSFVRYNDTTARPGFGRYLNSPYPDAIWLRYIQNSTFQMTDFEMNACINIKIIQNNSYTSLKDIAEAFWAVFSTHITVKDNTNMTITYHANNSYRLVLQIAAFLNILPRPGGVAATEVEDSTSSSSCSSSSSCRSSSSSSRSSSSSSCRSSSSSSSCRSSSSSCSSSSSAT